MSHPSLSTLASVLAFIAVVVGAYLYEGYQQRKPYNQFMDSCTTEWVSGELTQAQRLELISQANEDYDLNLVLPREKPLYARQARCEALWSRAQGARMR